MEQCDVGIKRECKRIYCSILTQQDVGVLFHDVKVTKWAGKIAIGSNCIIKSLAVMVGAKEGRQGC
jgi:hypothetical protein